MARDGVTFEQVAQVADALVGAGQQPTIRAVREGLGGTGSPNGCVAISGSGKVWYGRFSQKPHQKYPLQGS